MDARRRLAWKPTNTNADVRVRCAGEPKCCWTEVGVSKGHGGMWRSSQNNVGAMVRNGAYMGTTPRGERIGQLSLVLQYGCTALHAQAGVHSTSMRILLKTTRFMLEFVII
jgi:hypothetical protein